jgi:hypothetical protein
MGHKIWIGFTTMEKFEVGQNVKMTRKENTIFIE